MTTDLAFELTGAHRQRALVTQQMVVLGELLLNRMLDNFTVDELRAP